MAAFEIGDIVQLKSGGPKMTVKEISPEGSYVCRWFTGPKITQDVFEADTIEAADSRTREAAALLAALRELSLEELRHLAETGKLLGEESEEKDS